MADREPVAWITVKGRRVPIYDGESKADAVKKFTSSRSSVTPEKEDDKYFQRSRDMRKQEERDKVERAKAVVKGTAHQLGFTSKQQKAAELARKKLDFNRPGDYAEITENHWRGSAGISNKRMASIMSDQDSKYDYEYQIEHDGKTEHHRMYRIPK